jgi:hypothetical protein
MRSKLVGIIGLQLQGQGYSKTSDTVIDKQECYKVDDTIGCDNIVIS